MSPISSGEGSKIDFSDRTTIEARLRGQQETIARLLAELETLYRTAPVGLTAFDRDLRCARINDMMAAFTGVAADECVGRPLRAYMPAVIADVVERDLRRVLVTGEPLLHVTRSGDEAASPGRPRDFDVSYYPVTSAAGDVGGVHVVVVDVTEQKRTAHQLQDREAHLRLALEAATAGSWAWHADTQESSWDEIFHAQYAFAADHPCGGFQSWITCIHPDDRSRLLDRLEQMRTAAGHDRWEEEFRAVLPTGEVRWMAVLGAAERDEAGALIRMAGLNFDISARKRREHHLAFSEALEIELSGGRSEDELLQVAGARIAAHFGLDYCLLVSIDEPAGTATVRHDHHAPDLPSLVGTYRLVEFHAETERATLAAGRPLVVDNVHADRSERHAAAFEALRVSALLNAPVVVDGRWTFMLSALHRTPYRWREDERDLLMDLARRIALRLERAHAREAVRASADQLRFIADHVPVLLVQCDIEERYTFVNAAYAERFGLQPHEIVGRRIVDVVGAEAYGSFRRHVRAALGGERVQFEEEVPYAYGTRWMQGQYVPHLDPEGQTRGFVALIQDVTDARRSHLAAAQLAAIVASSSDAILSKTLDGIITTWNAGAERLFGYTAAEIVGQSVRRLIPAEHLDEEDHILARLRAGETIAHFDTVRITKTGRRIEVSLTISPILDAAGRVVGASKTVRDITDRKSGERALGASEARFRGMFENAAVGIGLLDATGRFLRVNQTLCAMTGYSADELHARRFSDITHPDDLETELGVARELVAGACESYSLDKRYVRKDGSTLWAALTVSRAPTVGDEPPTFVAIAQDISVRKAAESALREADRQKDEFLATLAHELRNPLAPVRTSVALLKTRPLHDPLLARSRDIIDRQVAHMARLLDDLLDIARLSRGKLTLRKAPTRLAEVLSAAVETSLPLLDQKGQALTIENLDDGIVLDADPARLMQVFGNLLNNASKFSPAHTPIALTAMFEHGTAVVSVRDRGVGISPELLPSVFDLFTQAETSDALAPGGLGIGLALARRLVELHGGTLDATSEGPGRGSTFTVRLPAAGAAALVETSGEAEPPLPPVIVRRRVLVVDDNADAADTLALLLTQVGCDVRAVYAGEAAVHEAEAFRPDIVFLDLGLPDVDGPQVCQRIRAQPWGSHMTLVALTGWGSQTHLVGFDAHLVKPADPAAVVQQVRNLSHRHVP